MSNILVDAPAQDVVIDGVTYAINTDFRPCLRVIMAFEDNELTAIEKQFIMLSNLYPISPTDIEQATIKASWFLNGGKDVDEDEQDTTVRLYSFKQDANFIFAAFRQTHNIDLQSVEGLHWWSFLSLFMDLGSETTFCQLVSLRKRLHDGSATKEEKKLALEIGSIVELEKIDTHTLEEKERMAEFKRLAQA